MKRSISAVFNVLLVLALAWGCRALDPSAEARAATSAVGPRHVYLTWQSDTSTTITVNFQMMGKSRSSVVFYDELSRAGDTTSYRHKVTGTRRQIPGLKDQRTIHRVELTGLKSATTYYFVAGNDEAGFSAQRKFRTAPADDRPIRFVTGGDMGVETTAKSLLKQAAKHRPLFGLIGGDLAYVDGHLPSYRRWDKWLDNWQESMISPDGYTIPMVLAIGNHEVAGSFDQTPDKAPFYFNYFAQHPTQSYFTRTFGKNVALFVLDSGHVTPHGGAQAAWLERAMEQHRDVPFRFAVYHVPLYPSYRSYGGEYSAKGREHWAPLFDKFALTAAFENHDHTYKRTHLLYHNQIAEKGTLYLGDGCFGMRARSAANRKQWYLVQTAALQHFWVVDVTGDGVEYRAIDIEGQVFDVYPPSAPGAEEAAIVFGLSALPPHVMVQATDTPFGKPVDATVQWQLTNPLDQTLKIRCRVNPVAGIVARPQRRKFSIKPGRTAKMDIKLTSTAPVTRPGASVTWEFGTKSKSFKHSRDVRLRFRRTAEAISLNITPAMNGELPGSLKDTLANVTGFIRRATGDPAPRETEVWVAATDKGLYFHAVCHDPKTGSYQPITTEQDSYTNSPLALPPGSKFWQDGALEIFLIPRQEPEGYMQYGITMGGATIINIRSPAKGDQAIGNSDLKVYLKPDRWIVELLIPWQDFGIAQRPAPGTVWRLDVARSHFRIPDGDISRWVNLERLNHALASYGYLRFID